MAKKNNAPENDPVIAAEILRNAKTALDSEKPRSPVRCSICGSDASPNSIEILCWVCRRLKISAWRDVDQQIAAQE
jgi:hypothetical protein